MNNEPVAWMRENKVWEGKYNFSKEKPPAYPNAIPLYTHPVKELTDEEIDEIAKKCDEDEEQGKTHEFWYRNFARAILRKAQE